MAVLELRALSKRFGKKTVVDDVSFCVESKEIFGFLGPNGAGKTTTIKMITGLLRMSGGEVMICGENLQKNFEKAMRNVGCIIENPELYDYLTGRQNLKLFMSMNTKCDTLRMQEVIEMVGLSKRIDEKVKRYSLGMRQRLGVAQALVHRPKVLVLDEPTNGLDPAGIKDLRDLLKRLAHEEGLAVLISSHLLSEMELMCDRYAILDQGKILSINTIEHAQTASSADIKSTYCIEVDDCARALTVLSPVYADLVLLEQSRKSGNVWVQATRRELLGVNNQLFAQGVNLYTVTKEEKTLEEMFLETTAKHKSDAQIE